MSYIKATKKEAKKLLFLLKSKTKKDLYELSDPDNQDTQNILAIAKGFSGYSHFKKELNNPLKNESTYKNSLFQFTKDDVVNDIYPEFTVINNEQSPTISGLENPQPILFFNKIIERDTILFCEDDDTPLSHLLLEQAKGLLVMGQDIDRKKMSFQADVTISAKPITTQTIIDPINPFRKKFNSLYNLIPHYLNEWLIFNLNYDDNNEERKETLILKSFKGFFNLNYLVRLKNSDTVNYLRSIGIEENNVITDEAIKQHLFYCRQGLIFSQIMIDYPHCFSEKAKFNIQINTKQSRVFVEIEEPTKNYDKNKEHLYEASKIIKTMIFEQLYKEQLKKCPYALIALFNINSKDNILNNTILINNKTHRAHIDTAYFKTAVVSKSEDGSDCFSLKLKKFILSSGTYNHFINLKPKEKVYISSDGQFKKINSS